MNNAGSVLALAPAGTDANSKASTAKILGIVAIVLGIINLIGWVGGGISNMLG